jgi:Tfp pilus assembly protein PilF
VRVLFFDRWRSWRTRLRLLVFSALGLLSATAGALVLYRHRQAQDCLTQAEQALADHDCARARNCLSRYLEMRPDSAEGHFLLARACRCLRTEEEVPARQHLEEARRLSWPAESVRLESTLLSFQLDGNPGEQEIALRQALAAGIFDEPLILEALVRGCLRANRMPEAGAWLDHWVQQHPDDWYARLWRAAFYQHTGLSHLAVAEYETALRLRPEDPEIHQRLGLMLTHSGIDYPRALQLLQEHLREHPDDPDSLVAVARCRRVLQQPQEAQGILERVVGAHPEHADALLALALVELDRNDQAGALKYLRRLEPLIWRGRGEEALARLRRLEPIATDAVSSRQIQTVLHLLASTLRRAGYPDEARAYTQKLLQFEADVQALKVAVQEQQSKRADPALLDRIGDLYLRVGMGPEAESYFLQALRYAPNDQRAHRALAEYYAARSQDPECRRRAELHRRRAEDKR